MSLGAPREEKDKSGGKCLASDVAINSIWYVLINQRYHSLGLCDFSY